MKFSKPEYSLGRVDAAGRALANSVGSPMQEISPEDLDVIKNWRASHHFPLQIIKMMLKGRAKRIDASALVSQRMKRLPSIQNKLVRSQSSTMRFSQMQDIGGCRAVLSNINGVDKLIRLFDKSTSKNPTGRHQLVSSRDYIHEPKEDGYRGVHYGFRYRSDVPARERWNGLRIEIQIRSKLQHVWATAVETVDTLTGQSLKFALGTNIGDPDWRRFFALMGSAMAIKERRPVVPNTPTSRKELLRELRTVSKSISAERILSQLSETVRVIEGEKMKRGAAEYLLVLDSRAKSIHIKSFSKDQLPLLEEDYLSMEKEANPDIQVVQVSVEDIAALRTAYPNYYLDTRAFVKELQIALRDLSGR